ncbi:MAG: hypothetical protein EBZ91_12545, partial [Gammaproteobacteria bacterium]|nr:hypothetical protein [Gammaproteobacteria bacterium]
MAPGTPGKPSVPRSAAFRARNVALVARLTKSTNALGCDLLADYISSLDAMVKDKDAVQCTQFYAAADRLAAAVKAEVLAVIAVLPAVTPAVRASIDSLDTSLRAFVRQVAAPLCPKNKKVFKAADLRARLFVIRQMYCVQPTPKPTP